MLEVMPESKEKVLWLRASGQLTDKDYREVFIPKLEAIIREYGKVRLLFQLDPDFEGWSMAALWDDFKLDLKHRNNFEKIALVGGSRWVDALMKLFARFMDAEVRTMMREQLAEAWEWIQPEINLQTNYERQE